MAAPIPMPVISRNCPAYTNDDFSGSFPASNANNAVYGGQNYWRCAAAPTGNANSGTLTQSPGFTTTFPVYLAYDLSGVPSAQRQNVVLVWYNDPATDPYNSVIAGTNYFNSPSDYTIDINTAAGGTLPTTGWSTQVTVSATPYHSRQHLISMNGANWIRMNVTAINGSSLNNNCAVNMDVHDVHLANQDNYILFGDSIGQRGVDHDDIAISATLPEMINAKIPGNYPLMENGGIGGQKAADIVAGNYFSTWLPLFSGKYVGICYGSNDANAGGAPVTNFQSNMTTLINAVLTAGKVPIVPKIPWGTQGGLPTNLPTCNAVIDGLYTSFPQIIRGPDFYTYFNNNQSLISGDGLHPTDPAGYQAYRQQWANTLVASVYTSGSPYLIRGHKFGRVWP